MNEQVRRRGEAGESGAGPQYCLWEKAFELAVSIFKVVDRIPAELGLALPGQMRLAALALPSHLSYSRSRRSPREYARALGAALQALTELESQVSLCCELGYAGAAEERRLLSAIRDLKRGATRILRSVRSSLSASRLQALSDEISTLVCDGKRDGAGDRS